MSKKISTITEEMSINKHFEMPFSSFFAYDIIMARAGPDRAAARFFGQGRGRAKIMGYFHPCFRLFFLTKFKFYVKNDEFLTTFLAEKNKKSLEN